MRVVLLLAPALCLGRAAQSGTSAARVSELARIGAAGSSCDSLLQAHRDEEQEQSRWIVRQSLERHGGTVGC